MNKSSTLIVSLSAAICLLSNPTVAMEDQEDVGAITRVGAGTLSLAGAGTLNSLESQNSSKINVGSGATVRCTRAYYEGNRDKFILKQGARIVDIDSGEILEAQPAAEERKAQENN